MKTSLYQLLIFIFPLFVVIIVKGHSNHTLEVTVNDLRNDKGKVIVYLSDANQNAVQDKETDIKDGKCKVIFTTLAPGDYAVSYIHDENSNGDLDTGTFGIPIEGYGFSNNARGMMGPPAFKKRLFVLQKDTVISLTTEY